MNTTHPMPPVRGERKQLVLSRETLRWLTSSAPDEKDDPKSKQQGGCYSQVTICETIATNNCATDNCTAGPPCGYEDRDRRPEDK